MNADPSFRYQEGNINVTLHETDRSIPKLNIDERLIDFLAAQAGKNEQLIRDSDFSLEFLLWEKVKGFLKFSLRPSGEKVEFSLEGEQLATFVDLLRTCCFNIGRNRNW